MNNRNQRKFNKRISTLIGILIILIWAVLAGWVLVQQLGELSKEVLEIPEEKISPVTDETADWQTYRNEEYGFEIKYPKNWGIKEQYNIEEGAAIAFDIIGEKTIESEAYPLTIEIQKQTILRDKAVEEWLRSKEDVDFKIDVIGTQAVNNKTATIVKADLALIGIEYGAILVSDGYVYSIYVSGAQDFAKDTERALYKMLSTFKFIPKIYSIIDLDDEMKEKLDERLLEVSDLYKEIKENPRDWPGWGPKSAENILNSSFGLIYKDKKYIFSYDYSGGAHCCFSWYIFKVNEDNYLERIEPTNPQGEKLRVTIGGNIGPGKDNFILKNNKLYLVVVDDRFAYDCGSYVGSPFFKRYFLIEEDKLILNNTDFKEEFIKTAIEDEGGLQDFYERMQLMTPEEIKKEMYSFDQWCPLLVRRTVNYLVAGEDKKAWENLDETFDKFSSISSELLKLYGKETTPEEIRTLINKKMIEGSY